jgi:hypothetical protein
MKVPLPDPSGLRAEPVGTSLLSENHYRFLALVCCHNLSAGTVRLAVYPYKKLNI